MKIFCINILNLFKNNLLSIFLNIFIKFKCNFSPNAFKVDQLKYSQIYVLEILHRRYNKIKLERSETFTAIYFEIKIIYLIIFQRFDKFLEEKQIV